jgi:hypothetical protein
VFLEETGELVGLLVREQENTNTFFSIPMSEIAVNIRKNHKEFMWILE